MKLNERFPDDPNFEEFTNDLARAVTNAKTEVEVKFVQETAERWNQYKGDTSLSDKQWNWLHGLAKGEAPKKKPAAKKKTDGVGVREYFIGCAMQGFVTKNGQLLPKDAQSAIRIADYLIKEMNK